MTFDDLAITTPTGALFARRWTPSTPAHSALPIVLLHDSLGCAAMWRDFPALLAEATGRWVVAYDRLGFGASSPHPGRLRTGFVEEEADGGFAAVITQLGIEHFIAMGHSVGGGMAVACAAAHPDACAGLVTIAAQAFVEDRTRDGIIAASAFFAQPGQLDKLRRYHGDKAEWVLASWVDTWLSPAFAAWTLDAALKKVRCPTLALHGDADEYGSPLHPQRIAALTGGQSVILEACGHVPQRQRTAAVLDAIACHLAALD